MWDWVAPAFLLQMQFPVGPNLAIMVVSHVDPVAIVPQPMSTVSLM